MKKFLFWLTFLILLFGLLSGCSNTKGESEEPKKTKDGKIIVDFWTFWGSETRRPIIEKIVDDYNASQDKVFINIPFCHGEIFGQRILQRLQQEIHQMSL
jgi:multiple sugar transport system substrate-binding protein